MLCKKFFLTALFDVVFRVLSHNVKFGHLQSKWKK